MLIKEKKTKRKEKKINDRNDKREKEYGDERLRDK